MTADEIRTMIAAWGRLWGVPGLEADVRVSFSRRLRASLGRCRLADGSVVLRTDLERSHEQLASVLCHEAAHIAAHRLAPGEPAHGARWRHLVALAGFTAETRARGGRSAEAASAHPQRLPYEHRCPVCQFVRFARRPMTRWRCPECVDVGLAGELIITVQRSTGQ